MEANTANQSTSVPNLLNWQHGLQTSPLGAR